MARKRKSTDKRDRTRRGVELPDPSQEVFGITRAQRALPKQEARGTFKVRAALDNLKDDLPAGVLYEPKPRKPRVDAVPVKAPTRAKAKAKDLDLTPAPTCKKRPDSRTKGSGARRPFVPYCK